MIRLILIAAIVFAVLWAYRKLSAPRNLRQNGQTRQFDAMVACDYCGLHVPQQEAIRQSDKVYCCQEHAEQDSK